MIEEGEKIIIQNGSERFQFQVVLIGFAPMARWSGFSTVTEVNRGSTFSLRRSTLDFCPGGQRS